MPAKSRWDLIRRLRVKYEFGCPQFPIIIPKIQVEGHALNFKYHYYYHRLHHYYYQQQALDLQACSVFKENLLCLKFRTSYSSLVDMCVGAMCTLKPTVLYPQDTSTAVAFQVFCFIVKLLCVSQLSSMRTRYNDLITTMG